MDSGARSRSRTAAGGGSVSLTVAPYDEDDIGPDGTIIRRINRKYHVIRDDNQGCERVSTKAFAPSSGENSGMSVDIEAKIIADGHDPRKYVTTPIFTSSVSFIAGSARALNLWIGYDPLPRNPYHGEVWGNTRPNRFTRKQKKGLLKASNWYVPLEGVEVG